LVNHLKPELLDQTTPKSNQLCAPPTHNPVKIRCPERHSLERNSDKVEFRVLSKPDNIEPNIFMLNELKC
jgi:hypothetical protein